MSDEKKICPFMSGASTSVSGGYVHNEIYDGPSPVTSYTKVCEVKCLGSRCMAWSDDPKILFDYEGNVVRSGVGCRLIP